MKRRHLPDHIWGEVFAVSTPSTACSDTATPRAEEDTRGVAKPAERTALDAESPSVALVGLSGYGQSGKDTAAAFMSEYGFARLAFADPLKAVAVECSTALRALVGEYGWEYVKREHPEHRVFLQHLGVAVREHVAEDAWVQACLRQVQPDRRYVITDVRFPNEAEAIKALGGVIVRVHRPGVGAVNAHHSETALDGWAFDAHVFNDGDLEHYRARVGLLLAELGLA